MRSIILLVSAVGVAFFILGLIVLLYLKATFALRALCGGILCFIGSHFAIAGLASLLKLRRMNIDGGG